MTRREIQEKINELLYMGDCFDIMQICKDDPTSYAIYYLIQIALKQQATIERITSILTYNK